jgi:hypothetical protein
LDRFEKNFKPENKQLTAFKPPGGVLKRDEQALGSASKPY